MGVYAAGLGLEVAGLVEVVEVVDGKPILRQHGQQNPIIPRNPKQPRNPRNSKIKRHGQKEQG